MDYLDPDKKREHRFRLYLGYALFVIAISFATLLLAYLANGYDVDRTTGQVIQNGLIYVDSRPGGAVVYVNDVRQRGTTDSRLVLPAGYHNLRIEREGYRSWNRTLQLEGGSLRQITYPRLIPTELTTNLGSALRSEPISALQSIDRRWIVMSFADAPLQLNIFDTRISSDSQTIIPVPITLPSTIVPLPTNGTIEFMEWADDNKHFIAKYSNSETVNYLLVNREQPEEAQNLSRLFGDSSYEISLQDRKPDKFFVYQASTQTLLTASLSNGVSSVPLVAKARAYKTFGRDWVLYITDSGEEGLVQARFKRGDKDFLLKKIKTSDKYLLQLAKLENSPIIGISSLKENRITVYKDPELFLSNNPDASIPVAATVLRVESPIDLRISSDASTITAYGQDNFASHEFKADRSYNFKIDRPVDISRELRWIDGQHFLINSEGIQVMIDFDGSNVQELVSSVPVLGSFYSSDFKFMYSFSPAVQASDTSPAGPAAIYVTNLLAPADR
jgi:hypothetical protein